MNKTRITIRLDNDVLDFFGFRDLEFKGGYQSRLNKALRSYVDVNKESIEDSIRRVIKEELKAGYKQLEMEI